MFDRSFVDAVHDFFMLPPAETRGNPRQPEPPEIAAVQILCRNPQGQTVKSCKGIDSDNTFHLNGIWTTF